VAPGVKFLVKSRKGTCRLVDKIDDLAAKYIHKCKILVTIEKDTGKIRRTRRRRTTARKPRSRCKLVPKVVETLPGEAEGTREVGTPSGNMRSPDLMSTLKRSIVKRMRKPKQNDTVARQLEFLREIAHFEQAMMVSEGCNYNPRSTIPSNIPEPAPPSAFPPFSSIMGLSNLVRPELYHILPIIKLTLLPFLTTAQIVSICIEF